MLSRVRTRANFCRKPLSKDLSKYAVPVAPKTMLQDFRSMAPTYWSDEEYEELFESDKSLSNICCNQPRMSMCVHSSLSYVQP
jgi:hypothetical protein